MRIVWSDGGGLGGAGILLGVCLILLGIVLFIWPQLLSWTLAGLLVVAGAGLIAGGLGGGRAVRFRRLDDWEGPRPG